MHATARNGLLDKCAWRFVAAKDLKRANGFMSSFRVRALRPIWWRRPLASTDFFDYHLARSERLIVMHALVADLSSRWTCIASLDLACRYAVESRSVPKLEPWGNVAYG